MLFNPVIFAHGYINSLKIRTTATPFNSSLGKVFKGTPPTVNVTLTGVGKLKSVAELQANLKAINSIYPDASPCRYNNVWEASNALKVGPLPVTWAVSEVHASSTCVFSLLKNGVHSGPLSEPFPCGDVISTAASKTITIPACSAAEKCSIQWFWNSDTPGSQYVNCMDFTTGTTTEAPPATGTPPAGSQTGGKCKSRVKNY